MTTTDHATPLGVLVTASAVLLLGVVTAAVQQGGDDSGRLAVQATPPATRSVTPPPATTRPPRTPPPPTAPQPRPTPPTVGSPATTTVSPPTVPTVQPSTPTPTPAPTSTPTSTPTPTPSPTAAPTPFEPGPPTTGSTTLDGVRLQVEVGHSQVQAGDVVRVTTTVTNTRTTPITYRTRCDNQVVVRAATGANATPSTAWSGDRLTFKRLALDNLVAAGNVFTSAAQFEGGPTPACPAPGRLVQLTPGQMLIEKHAWRAATAYGSGYDGQAPVTARFEFALVGGLSGALMPPEFSTVQTSAPLRLIGEGNGLVPPTVAVDAALRLPQFAMFVEQGDSAAWEPPYPAGSELGASIRLVEDSRPTYLVQLVRPDAAILVRVLADTGTPISVTVQ